MTIGRQLGVHHRLLRDELGALKEHISDVDRDFNHRLAQLEDYLARNAQGLTDEEEAELGDIYADEVAKLTNLFPNMHRRAYLITIVGALETFMDGLCRYTQRARSLEVSVTDLKGSGIERSRIYLRKVIGVQLPQSSNWEEVAIAQKIRNLVTHNRGALKDDDASRAIRTKAESSTRYRVSDRDEILLEEEFLPALLEDISEFSGQLIQTGPIKFGAFALQFADISRLIDTDQEARCLRFRG